MLAGLVVAGCSHVEVFPAPGHQLKTVVASMHPTGPCWSDSTANLLCRLGLDDLARDDSRAAFARVEQGVHDGPSDPALLLALAELADEKARTAGPLATDEAIAWSRDAAVYATFCLSALSLDRDSEATWAAACRVHNRATARCLSRAHTASPAERSGWPERLAAVGILPASDVPEWTSMGLTALQVANDRIVTGLDPKGRRDGLGVPLIARRGLDDSESIAWKPFGPEKAIFAATAVMRPNGSASNWRSQPIELMLLDPMRGETLDLGGRLFPIAADLTTPMASRLAQGPIRNYEYLGVVDPEFYAQRAGAYAVDPYQRGKVPVVLIHGLWSSPQVWVRMLDALRGDPAIRARYQFWVVLYPSGYSLPTAARTLRRSLREIRHRFDPQGNDPALDQMIILGKSTGGQVSRLLVQSSGDTLWNAIFTRPIDQIQASPNLRAELAETFYYEPEPYIRRTIFVATGHRGGKLARQPGIEFGVDLIRRTNPLRPAWAELRAANGPEVFQPSFRDDAPDSLDGMRANSPLLKAIDARGIAPEIAYHSIIATIHPWLPRQSMTDGFVRYTSAHLEGAASETIVSSTHVTAESDPEIIAEVRRILLEHGEETMAEPRLAEPGSSSRESPTLR